VKKDLLGLQPAGAFNASFFMTDWSGERSDISDNVIEGDPPLALVTDGHGESGGDQFGYSVSNAFDVNDDNIQDIIVGAPYNDNNATNAGAAYIFFGRSDFEPHGDLNATDANVTIHGLAANGNFGWSVSGAHDVDGDGVDDVIIGEPFNGTGQAYIFYGSGTWSGNHTTHDADIQISGEVNGDEFGYSVAGPGDVDNSQNDDVVIGAPEHTQMLTIYNLGNNQGRAYVLYGDGSIPSNATNADIKLDGEYSSDNFGRSVAGAGDVNDDGIPDVIIGANENLGVGGTFIFHGGSLEGTVTVMQMTHSGLTLPVDVANMAAQAFTPSTNGRVRFVDIAATDTGANSAVFPNSATALRIEIQTDNGGLPSGNIISSIEGDDFAQFPQGTLVRFTFSTPASVNANTRYWVVASCTDAANNGYGWLYRNANVYGGGFAANYSNGAWTAQNTQDMMFNVLVWPDVVLTGEDPDDGFGFSVDGAGDPSNDTIDDVIVGAPYNDAGGNNAGRAYVFYGNASMDDNIFASVVEPFPPGMGYHLNARFSRAQSFTTPAGGPMITHIWWAGFEAVANPAGGVTVSLQTSAAGLPSGVNLWSTNVVPGVNPAAAEAFWLDLKVSPNVQLNANTVYWIVFTCNVAHPNGYAVFPQDNNPYAGGTGAVLNNQGGGGWNTQGQVRDYLFRARAHADSRITGGSAGDRFGYSVSGAGDIDDDGNDDIVIGAPYADNGTVADAGAIYVFIGDLSFNNTAGNANFTNYGEQSNDHFGWSVDSGDFTGDGLSNIVVGAPGNDTPAADAGETTVWEIPEFQDVIIPIASVASIVLVLRRMRAGQSRKKRKKRPSPSHGYVRKRRKT
jgi:hypothetical protein